MFGSNNSKREQLEVTLDGEHIALRTWPTTSAEDGVQVRAPVKAGPHEFGRRLHQEEPRAGRRHQRAVRVQLFRARDRPRSRLDVRAASGEHLDHRVRSTTRRAATRRPREDIRMPARRRSATSKLRHADRRDARDARVSQPVDVEQMSRRSWASTTWAASTAAASTTASRWRCAGFWQAPSSCSASSAIRAGAQPGDTVSHERPRARVAALVLPVEQHPRRRAARASRPTTGSTSRAVLRRQVERMLADPRSQALIDNFAGQWLYLRNLETKGGSVEEFPDFDDNLREAFRTETELFFESIVREDRNVMDLLTADYTFVNERLAKHYGIPGVYGSSFRRVELTDDRAPRPARPRQHPHGHLVPEPHVARAARGLGAREHRRRTDPDAAAERAAARRHREARQPSRNAARANGAAREQAVLLGLPQDHGSRRLRARELRRRRPLARPRSTASRSTQRPSS